MNTRDQDRIDQIREAQRNWRAKQERNAATLDMMQRLGWQFEDPELRYEEQERDRQAWRNLGSMEA